MTQRREPMPIATQETLNRNHMLVAECWPYSLQSITMQYIYILFAFYCAYPHNTGLYCISTCSRDSIKQAVSTNGC